MSNSILLSNFPTPAYNKVLYVTLPKINRVVGYYGGFDSEYTAEQKKIQVVSKLLIALLVYDEIYILLGDYLQLFRILNPLEIHTLLKNKTIKIIQDRKCLPVVSSGVFLKNLKSKPVADKISLPIDSTDNPREFTAFSFEDENNAFGYIEYYLKKINNQTRVDILQFTENSYLEPLNEIKVDKLILNEISNDLNNNNIKNRFDIESKSIEDIKPSDTYKILRIANLNKNLIYQSIYKTKSNVIDGFGNEYLSAKISYSFLNQPTDVETNFKKIINSKGIPDFYYLYKNGIINIDDVIELRNNINGKKFRDWYFQNDYNNDELLGFLVNKNKVLKENKFVRWLYPNILGFIASPIGLIASAFDSFVLDKLIKGWQPELFLDEILKKRIDKNIQSFERKNKREKILQRYGNVDRNFPCPCQSGKKFKNCCGKL